MVKRFKVELSEGACFQVERRWDSWSCHLVRVGRKPLVIVMNDATLYTMILPATGMKGFTDFWVALMHRMGELWAKHGLDFEEKNQTVLMLARTNRTLMGTMNEVIRLIRYTFEERMEGKGELDLGEREEYANRTPYKAIGYDDPAGVMARALRGLAEQG